MESFKFKQTLLLSAHSKAFRFFVLVDLLNKLHQHNIKGVIVNYHIRKLEINETPDSLNNQILPKCYILK